MRPTSGPNAFGHRVSKISQCILLCALASGCAAVGNGGHTLIKAKDTQNVLPQLNGAFEHLLVSSGTPLEDRMVPMSAGAKIDDEEYRSYMIGKYGRADFSAAKLHVAFRDRAVSPSFLPIDLTSLLTGKIADLVLKPGIKLEEKNKLIDSLQARLLNRPDMIDRIVLHHRVASGPNKGRAAYYYYPRISVDFSSSLLSGSAVDRFSFLGMAIRLNSTKFDPLTGDKVRIVNVAPKDPDIAEYTRGQLTTKNEIQAKTAFGKTSSVESTESGTVPGKTDRTEGETDTRGANFGGDLAFTNTETYVNKLLDSIEARTVGIYDAGKMLLVEYRSIKNKRIGGTYTFDVMVEVPSSIKVCVSTATTKCAPKTYTSEPIETKLSVDVYMAGVIRHVHKRGFTGTWTEIPEPQNDDTYQQVVFVVEKNVPLWQFTDEPFTGEDLTKKDAFVLTVLTNRDDARFVVKGTPITSPGTPSAPISIIGKGKGAEAKISINPGLGYSNAFVEFLDIVVINEKSSAFRFQAAASSSFNIPASSGAHTVAGNYVP